LAFFWEGDSSACFVEPEAIALDDDDVAGGDGLRRFEDPEVTLDDDDRFLDGRCCWSSRTWVG